MTAIINAVADGLLDGGVQKVYGFPGFRSEDVLERINPSYSISTNERTAFAEAYGSSVGGARSLVAFKNIGLNIASDAYSHAVIAGVNAGLVMFITDDIEVWGSQECQDTRALIDYYGGLLFEPDSIQSAYDFSRGAFELSEKLDVPIIIRITNQTLKLHDTYLRDSSRSAGKKPVHAKLNPEKYVVHPYYFKKQHANLLDKKNHIKDYVNSLHAAEVATTTKSGVIRFGLGSGINRVNGGHDLLQVNTVPLPDNVLKEFVESHSETIITESGDPYVHSHSLLITSQKSSIVQSNTTPSHTIEFTKWTRYSDLFKIIKDTKRDTVVVGDITQFTVETEDVIDVALSMGASIPLAIGVAEVKGFALAVIGDCSFNHEGLQILYEAINRKSRICVLIIDNGVSWCTGGQENAVQIDQLILPPSVNYSKIQYSRDNLRKIKKDLTETFNFNGVSILHLEVPVGSLSR
jgi:indolepyruvate ferredoxin oxidoreductase, alpha subunit